RLIADKASYALTVERMPPQWRLPWRVLPSPSKADTLTDTGLPAFTARSHDSMLAPRTASRMAGVGCGIPFARVAQPFYQEIHHRPHPRQLATPVRHDQRGSQVTGHPAWQHAL